MQESTEQQNTSECQVIEEWMVICQRSADLVPNMNSTEAFNWTLAAQSYQNLD